MSNVDRVHLIAVKEDGYTIVFQDGLTTLTF